MAIDQDLLLHIREQKERLAMQHARAKAMWESSALSIGEVVVRLWRLACFCAAFHSYFSGKISLCKFSIYTLLAHRTNTP